MRTAITVTTAAALIFVSCLVSGLVAAQYLILHVIQGAL